MRVSTSIVEALSPNPDLSSLLVISLCREGHNEYVNSMSTTSLAAVLGSQPVSRPLSRHPYGRHHPP